MYVAITAVIPSVLTTCIWYMQSGLKSQTTLAKIAANHGTYERFKMKSQITIRNSIVSASKKKDTGKLGTYVSEEKLRIFRKLAWLDPCGLTPSVVYLN